MSLRFLFGPSGAGKSRRLYQEIADRSLEEPTKTFLVIVPDQFTMQTQKDLTAIHKRGGILNIDVLSFGRLCYRVFDEVGELDTPVLDDTGKSLVLQKVAGRMGAQLPALGSLLNKQGYIHEVKSALSEFMQYGVSVEDLEKLIGYSDNRGALVLKLRDLAKLYQGFQEYISGHFITTEESLDLLKRSLSASRLVAGSVVAFDGFTGFTPIQLRVIQEMMRLAEEVTICLTLGAGEDPYVLDGEQKLFHLTKKTVHDLVRLAQEANVPRGGDLFLTPGPEDRFRHSPALRSLEQNLFRYPSFPYEKEQKDVCVLEASTPREEVHQAGLKLQRLVREEGMAYRDVAFVLGDLEGYAPYVETEFSQMGIPYYLDKTRNIVLNPMVVYITSALELYQKDFSYEAVFHYLRSGLSDLSREEVDELEEYCICTGVRGLRAWSRLFVKKTPEMGEDEEVLLRLNGIRERFLGQVECLHGPKTETVGGRVKRLYQFLSENKVQEKLSRFERKFQEENDPARAREYAQIYRLVVDLLDQVYELLDQESVTLQEFAELLEAGFGELKVGTIPQNVDRVVVGDMERTRLKQVKVLFFLGVNDGNIPRAASKGGILSDMDREFLQGSDVELAPSPRQQMYIQRFYLYLNMTKPSRRLYLSFAKIDNEGRSIRPAYLIDVVRKLFPALKVECPQNEPLLSQVVTYAEGVGYLAEGLRCYVQGSLQGGEGELFALYAAYGESEDGRKVREKLVEAAFRRYRESGLSRAVARALYGQMLENSTSRLETYAACAYRHFLQYGLSLKEREDFGFESVDMGNVFHGVLERFSRRLSESDYTWFDFPREFGEKEVRDALEAYAAQYGETVLYSSSRNEYAITRMGRVLTRTVFTLKEQLKAGVFVPDAYEMSFQYADDLDSIRVSLSPEEKMRLQGRIDRIDTAQDEGHVYVKVIDYKSGRKQFDLAALYYGLQLQLVVYMNAALELEGKKHPDKEVVPAAMLYYHIEDPTVESPVELGEEELDEQIRKKLRMKGVVSAREGVVEKLDRYLEGSSMIIPVERKKDGSFSARSSVMTQEELQLVSDYVNWKVRSIGRQILEGKASLNPYEKGGEDACTYCPYKRVCGFDAAVPGMKKRTLLDLGKEEALGLMERSAREE